MIPAVLRHACRNYEYLPSLLGIAESGARVPLAGQLPQQSARPPNHRSADERYNVLVKNIRREQDAWRCIVVDDDILEIWPEVHASPFGVVDKGNGDPQTTGRVIHDLSCPVNRSLNDHTNRDAIYQPKYKHCDAVAAAIVQEKKRHPGAEVKEQAGDVSSAYRHVCIHSHCVHLFGGRLHRDNVLIIDMSAAFGWSGSPGNYGVVGGAISFIHGHTTNQLNPLGFFSYHWVDDHINVAADVGSNCSDMEQSLRLAMLTVLGPAAINEDKFSGWNTKQKALGLIFDSTAGVVSMPADKIAKAYRIVRAALGATSMSRTAYRSLLGSLRHVRHAFVRPGRSYNVYGNTNDTYTVGNRFR
ncbi:hypothetical protein PR003_g1012 [Phytophthora rubi]|uniref:Uncharacterized protein n=1 Tax=Phytophthora rubi TaxID=129364 RepID=A0A6A4G4G0_9STRA|nr:hypothetical protein PR001_g794 [Phytophthora rubi]KAE9358966.1 hypothetical protein PR003_g1012 [Phytophthora rubi]